MRRSTSRSVIGGSNRRVYTTASDGSLAGSPALRPRTPVVYQTEAERRKEIVLAPVIPPTVTSITTLQQFSGSSFNNSSADLETCDMTTGPQLRAVRRPRPKSGELPPSLTQSMYPIVQRPATVGGSQSSLNGSRPATVGSQPSSDHFRKVNTTTITGAQEYAVQVMTDFFGRRPIEHMRNAFRNADVDDSGELDQLEFRQAIKAMKCGLGDKDADALFKLADQDGSGSIGIHEFFVNFRHDHWPRERFFWTKPEPNVNLAGNLTKKERVDLSDALAVQFDQPAQLSTPDIMKVLAEKVAVHGSAEKVFRVIDTNVNGKVDLDEIPEALRPFELHVSQQQAKEVLKEINRIVGKPADAPITYNSFAVAFNPTAGPPRMGSVAFQEPQTNVHVRQREPIDEREYASLGPTRSLESLHASRSSSAGFAAFGERSMDEHMRSLHCIAPTPPLSHAATTQTLRGIERDREARGRLDQMAGWRNAQGDEAIDGGGDLLGKEILKTGRDIDWRSNIQGPAKQSMFASASAPNLLSTTLEMGVAAPSRTPPAVASPTKAPPQTGAEAAPVAAADTKSAEAPPPTGSRSPLLPSYAAPTIASRKQQEPSLPPAFSSQSTLGSLSSSMANSTLMRTRSRIELARDLAGSRSSRECLYPDETSHHHVHELDRLAHTSSIAALNSMSSAAGGAGSSKEIGFQRFDKECRADRLRSIGARQQERQELLSQMVLHVEKSMASLDALHRNKAQAYNRRVGHHQLIELTRGMEHGHAPVLLEPSPLPNWAPVPPHMSSHWKTISGHHVDPPRDPQAHKLHAAGGRKSMKWLSESPPVVDSRRVVWGGSHA